MSCTIVADFGSCTPGSSGVTEEEERRGESIGKSFSVGEDFSGSSAGVDTEICSFDGDDADAIPSFASGCNKSENADASDEDDAGGGVLCVSFSHWTS